MEMTTRLAKPTSDEIAHLAYRIWEEEGKAPGRDMDHWLQAETLLMALAELPEPGLAEVVALSKPAKQKRGKNSRRVVARMAA